MIKKLNMGSYRGPQYTSTYRDYYEVARACRLQHTVRETVIIAGIDAEGAVRGIYQIAEGVECETEIRLEDVLAVAAELGLTDYVIAASHPSCNPWPTEEEMQQVRGIYYGCLEHDLFLRDYVVVTPDEREKCSFFMHGIFDDDFDED